MCFETFRLAAPHHQSRLPPWPLPPLLPPPRMPRFSPSRSTSSRPPDESDDEPLFIDASQEEGVDAGFEESVSSLVAASPLCAARTRSLAASARATNSEAAAPTVSATRQLPPGIANCSGPAAKSEPAAAVGESSSEVPGCAPPVEIQAQLESVRRLAQASHVAALRAQAHADDAARAAAEAGRRRADAQAEIAAAKARVDEARKRAAAIDEMDAGSWGKELPAREAAVAEAERALAAARERAKAARRVEGEAITEAARARATAEATRRRESEAAEQLQRSERRADEAKMADTGSGQREQHATEDNGTPPLPLAGPGVQQTTPTAPGNTSPSSSGQAAEGPGGASVAAAMAIAAEEAARLESELCACDEEYSRQETAESQGARVLWRLGTAGLAEEAMAGPRATGVCGLCLGKGIQGGDS